MDFNRVKTGKLKLKGEKKEKKHKKRRREEEGGEGAPPSSSGGDTAKADTLAHGGWWRTTAAHQIKENVAIQMGRNPVYMRASDDGTFALGPLHDEGDGPSPEEVLTVVPTGDGRKLAFKSGYGRYIGIDPKGRLVALAEAIGPKEMWTPIFQEGQSALLSATECFVGVDEDEGVKATCPTVASDMHRLVFRCNYMREEDKPEEIPFEEQGSLKDIELKHIRKFQKFMDKRTKVNPDGRVVLKEAKGAGKLHEALLDRRSKMKADRYCK